jgi:ribosome-associated protein
MPLVVSAQIAIPDDEIEITYVRASGPGGQNVNKVSTAAQLRFDARSSPSLPDDVATRLIKLAGAKATKDGVIVIQADRFRRQEQNRADALARLLALTQKAAHRPKKRVATKPTMASREKRLRSKAKHGEVKKTRARKPEMD